MDLHETLQILNEAKAAFDDAEREESVARSKSVEALNNLNQAQRAFDKLIHEIKEAAPYRSDWKSYPE